MQRNEGQAKVETGGGWRLRKAWAELEEVRGMCGGPVVRYGSALDGLVRSVGHVLGWAEVQGDEDLGDRLARLEGVVLDQAGDVARCRAEMAALERGKLLALEKRIAVLARETLHCMRWLAKTVPGTIDDLAGVFDDDDEKPAA